MRHLNKILSTKEGREFVTDLLDFCGVYRSAPSPETNSILIREGKRQVGLYLVDTIINSENRSDWYKLQDEMYQDNKEKLNEQESRDRDAEREHEDGTFVNFNKYAGLDYESSYGESNHVSESGGLDL